MTLHSLPTVEFAGPAATRIEFRDDLVTFDDVRGTMSLSPTGRTYYEGWFRRFGFRLDETDVEGFIKTVMFINRECSPLEEGRLRALVDGGSLSARERELWEQYLAGDFEEFAVTLSTMVDEVTAVPSNVVQLFARRA